jgi:riboflavin-specific deaminase-like protein
MASMPTGARALEATPFVTLHFAQSIDGRIATRSGDARWISGPEATRFAHELRAESDAVVVGSGTALADDPALTVRHVVGPSPTRVVLDGRARLPRERRVFVDPVAPTIHVVRAPAEEEQRGHVERWAVAEAPDGGLDLAELLARLGARGMRRVLVEGGRGVLTSFLRRRLVDRVLVAIAPIVLGDGIDAVGDLGTERLDQAIRMSTRRTFQLGEDVLVELVTERGARALG